MRGIQWFDPTAFTAPTPGTWGNLKHNKVRGPGRDDWNLALRKNFNFAAQAWLGITDRNPRDAVAWASPGLDLARQGRSVPPLFWRIVFSEQILATDGE